MVYRLRGRDAVFSAALDDEREAALDRLEERLDLAATDGPAPDNHNQDVPGQERGDDGERGRQLLPDRGQVPFEEVEAGVPRLKSRGVLGAGKRTGPH